MTREKGKLWRHKANTMAAVTAVTLVPSPVPHLIHKRKEKRELIFAAESNTKMKKYGT